MISATKWLTLACLAIAPCFLYGADTAALAKRLHNAADASSLDDPTLKPWHLKLVVQLYDAKGNPSEKGTVEEWWTFEKDKRVYTTQTYSATEIRRSKSLFRTVDRPTVPYLLNAIREQVVHPMATTEEIDSSQPDVRSQSFGKAKLDCIMLDQPIKNVAYPPLGLFPTYCVDPKNDLLRLSYRFGAESAVLNTTGTFQGRKVALDPSISADGRQVISAHIESLDGRVFDPSVFTTEIGLEEHETDATKIEAAVMAGMILKKVAPVYPEVAKANHVDGVVHLDAIIGTDGHIHRLRILDAADSSLAVSALEAVRQSSYNPYLLDGLPVEVNTTITVNYKFSVN